MVRNFWLSYKLLTCSLLNSVSQAWSPYPKTPQRLGAKLFEQKTTAFVQPTIRRGASWLKLTQLNGLHGLTEVYQDVCEGKVNLKPG